MFLRLKCVCRDKHCSCLDKSCVCRDKSASVATKMCMFLSPQNLDFCRAKSGINICVTSTRFSCCDDILVKGWSYMNQSKSVLLMALVLPLKICKLQALVYDILPWRNVSESDARSVELVLTARNQVYSVCCKFAFWALPVFDETKLFVMVPES